MTLKELKQQYGIQHSGRFVCPICGRHKTHYRLSGYRCDVHGHASKEREFSATAIEWLIAGKITRAEYELEFYGETDEQS